jgi:hypothetical protein
MEVGRVTWYFVLIVTNGDAVVLGINS